MKKKKAESTNTGKPAYPRLMAERTVIIATATEKSNRSQTIGHLCLAKNEGEKRWRNTNREEMRSSSMKKKGDQSQD